MYSANHMRAISQLCKDVRRMDVVLVLAAALLAVPATSQAEPEAVPAVAAKKKKGPAAAKAARAADKPRVAILYFDYRGSDEELGFLRKGLTQMLVTDLSQLDGLVVLERNDLEEVLKELELSQSKYIDRKTANRIGKALGARYLVTGGYFVYKDKLRVDAKVIDVQTFAIKSVSETEPLDGFMELETRLVGKLEGTLNAVHAGNRASKPKAGNTSTKTPGDKLARKGVSAHTVARYGKALDAMDQGNTKIAMKELDSIKKDAPDFQFASDELKGLLR